MEDKIGWIRFLKGKLAREEEAKFYQMLPEIEEGEKVYAAIMKIDTDTIENTGGMMNILAELQKLGQKLKPIYLAPDTLFLLMYMPQEAQDQEILDCYMGMLGSSGEQLWNYELFYCKQCNYRIRTASNML